MRRLKGRLEIDWWFTITSDSNPSGYDSSALAYMAAVEIADGQPLETGVAIAINDFVVGLKADGIWNKIDQAGLLSCTRSLAGALVPLKGNAVTNVNFVSGDYNRITGLVGDASTKFLRADVPVYGQNDGHISVVFGASFTAPGTQCAMGATDVAYSQLTFSNVSRFPRVNTQTGGAATGSAVGMNGFWGVTRSTASDLTERYGGADTVFASTSGVPSGDNLKVFARGSDALAANNTSARLKWFSHGRDISLSALEARLTTLYAAVAAALA